MTDMGVMPTWMTLDEAATTLNRSHRTLQRWVADGKLKSEIREGRTTVEVETPSGEAIAQIQRQADDTGKVAAMAMVTSEHTMVVYREHATEMERRVNEERRATKGWRWMAVGSCACAVVSLVILSWTWGEAGVTRDILTATHAQLDRAEAARERLERVMAGMTASATMARSVTPHYLAKSEAEAASPPPVE